MSAGGGRSCRCGGSRDIWVNIIGLEVAGSWWPGAHHVVRLHRRTGPPIRIDAHTSDDVAQQAAAWLANDLETRVLDRSDRSTPLNIAITP